MIDKEKLECVYENKFWISITGLCNNNCLFCLDSDRKDNNHKSITYLKNEIKKARKTNTKLIISGGDPSIHPQLEELIIYAKELKYSKIQLITNGRMFSSKDFTNKLIYAGLDEITFSIHSHLPEIHDKLTNVDGSFRQILKGILNVRQNNLNPNIIVNTDTCVTKKNYKNLDKTIEFIYKILKINEINLMIMLPQGNAWKLKNEIMVDSKIILSYIKKIISYSKLNNINLWLSRFPDKYLKNNEEFIEDPYKSIDEVRGRLNLFEQNKLDCKGEKCKYCSIQNICNNLLNIDSIKKEEELLINDFEEIIELNYDNIEYINNKIKNSNYKILLIIKKVLKLTEYCKKDYYSNMLLKINHSKNLYFSDIPFCVLKKHNFPQESYIEFNDILSIQNNNIMDLTKKFSLNKKVKFDMCYLCSYNSKCKGVNVNYVRNFKSKEIAIIKNNYNLGLK